VLEAVAEAPGDDRAAGESGAKHLLLDLTPPLVGGTELNRKIKAVFDKLERAEQVMVALAAAVEANDVYTGPHTQRVGAAAQRVGERLGLPDGELETLLRGGLVHDIGKIGIPDSVLLKPGPLSEDEMSTMRQHPVIGAEIVSPLSSAAALIPIIRHHHEHFDGSGYPDGLAGHGIPLPARIVAVCDAYDALTSDRPYRRGRSRAEALRVLKLGAGRQWDPELVELVAADPFSLRPG
jgi:putative two-component system response regulator